MVLLLNDNDVRNATEGIDMHACTMEVIEGALTDMAGDPDARLPHETPSRSTGAINVISAMGQLPAARLLGGRVNCVGRPRNGGRPIHNAFKLVFDADTLGLVAVVEDGAVHAHMLAARVAVATKHLARAESTRVGVLGSGRMARAGLAGVLGVLPRCTQVTVYSPDRQHREALAREVEDSQLIEAEAVGHAREAVTGQDVVLCATNNYFRDGPAVVHGDWLDPGTHVNSIARGELDPTTYRCARIFPSSLPDLLAIRPEWDDLGSLRNEGLISLQHDLAQVVAGTAVGRTGPSDRTVFVGASTGAEHLAVGQWICSLARASGIGTEWDLDAEPHVSLAGADGGRSS